MAREMEEAGKKGREDLIREKTEELLFTYRRLNERLTPLFTSDGKKKEMTPTMQHEAFQTIGEIAESCDYGLMEELVRDLKGYELSGESKEALQKIEKMLTELDWDGIVQEAQRILEQEE